MKKLSHWVASTVLVFAVVMLLVPSHIVAQGQGGGGGAEQPLVNVQVLKGMTRPQIVARMQQINVQLGTACTFCHVQKDGRNDFPAEDKQHKLIAREMMRMVQTINQQAGMSAVSRQVDCWTCHRGSPAIANPPVPPPPPAPPQGGGGGGGGGRGGAPQQ
jgi:photosynthetic reaction center cytochrome c subunit